MKVSVVVCTYSMKRYDAFSACIESVLGQDYDPLELVIIIDGNEALTERAIEGFGEHENVTLHLNDENRGISYSRTKGAKLAAGEVAMIDDDAVAESDWIEQLVGVYKETDAIAVGGHVAPNWVNGKPDFFPEEFYWLVGCDERGFGEHMEELRNTYGSNVSFRREAFLSVGGYDENTGRKGDKHVQAHEAPVCIRLCEQYGKGVIYNTEAVVHHTLFEYAKFAWLGNMRSRTFDTLDIAVLGFFVTQGLIGIYTVAWWPTESETNLRPFRDGGLIIFTLYRLARTHNPLFYFGSVGVSTMVLGLFTASWVGYRWLVYTTAHEVVALFAASAFLFGMQLVVFGLLSDLIVTLHREQMRRLDERER